MFHLLRKYVILLCNWLILWQNAFYLYFGRSRMCLILQKTLFQDQVLKPCKSVQDSSWKVPVIKARQLAIYRGLKSCLVLWLDSSSIDRVFVEVYEKQNFKSVSGSLYLKNRFSSLFSIFTVRPPGPVWVWKPCITNGLSFPLYLF